MSEARVPSDPFPPTRLAPPRGGISGLSNSMRHEERPKGAGSPSLLYTVKQVELVVRSHLDDLLRPAGVTALQFTALTVLRRRDGLTAAELARNSFVRTQTMADMVATLERQRLISRTKDPHDKRRVLISLTDEGRSLLREYDGPVAALEQQMVQELSADEVDQLRNALNACRRALADHPPH